MEQSLSTPDMPAAAPATPVVDDPAAAEKLQSASQWRLMWWRFKRHRLAVVSMVVVIGLYIMAAFAPFWAPYGPNTRDVTLANMPPMPVRIIHEGELRAPFVYARERERDPETFQWIYSNITERPLTIHFFINTGEQYKLLGLIDTDLRFFGLKSEDQRIFLMGNDILGRDMLSRIIYGSTISMSIGLAGVIMSTVFGLFFGGISGYFGGWIDMIIQRVIEFLQSLPSIPLWMALAAAMPLEWSSVQVYFAITIILSFMAWTGLARVVRGKFLSLREEDFVKSAKMAGASEMRIIFRHMLPSFFSHIIASLTLAIPAMILAETSLSFLGVGMRPPAVSWGVLLQEAQSLTAVALTPWLLAPAIPVVIAILAFNFMGDGLRDAADPYSKV